MRMIAVDDECPALKDIMDTIARTLPDSSIEGFINPAEALESARKEPVDVAFLDIELEGMNGLELARALKEIRGQTNIVFTTGYSQYALEAFSLFASGYLLKPVTEKDVQRVMDNLRYPVMSKGHGLLRVQTFGNFEVFSGDTPLHFPRSKSKELFAYLIHKRGSACSTRELAAVLFEDRPYTVSMQKQVQTVISALMRTLREAGAQDCVVKRYNQLAVDVDKVDCDYYQFLEWNAQAVNSYTGEYMCNYSWAEFVSGYLNRRLT